MTSIRRKTAIFTLATFVLAATAMVAYGFRDQLAAMPVLGTLLAAGDPDPAAHEAGDHAPAPPVDPQVADPRAPLELDLRRQQLIGVRTAAVERAAVARTIRTVGTVRYDETRLADVNLKVEGWIRDLFVNYTGRAVSRGEPLFTLYSPDLLTTQQEYLLALKTRDQLRQSQIADVRERAERLVDSARMRIALWDLPADQMRALDETRQPQTAVTFLAPVSGYVIEKQAIEGMHVNPGETLFKIADLSRVWVEADVYEQEMPLIRVGQSATVVLDAYPDERFTGRVIYIYPFVEENTRTVKVRFDFANRGGRLKPGMYANVSLDAPLGMSTTIPSNALLDSGTRQLVFVAEGGGYFQPRDVKVGQRLGDRVQILEGLKPSEQVAVGATFFLDSESQLRAAVQSFEAPQTGAPAGARPDDRLEIAFRSQPDPPRAGDNVFEVTVKDASGPIADAEVSVTFFMAAMPSMNMPAMRSETKLTPAGGGLYRGAGQVMTPGRWDVTVNVSKGGQRLGSRQFVVVAR
ncbi:MAG: efflux RND transporter periplasmic adaptor subunit [Acidobacteria bacterium]|nr:efflux RND transporter periplasmic adaptor subunit [Acidobacteriota bacterium]